MTLVDIVVQLRLSGTEEGAEGQGMGLEGQTENTLQTGSKRQAVLQYGSSLCFTNRHGK